MSRSNAKKIFLVLLIATCLYIWQRNLSSYYDEGAGYYQGFELFADSEPRPSVAGRQLEVRPVKLNPFLRASKPSLPPPKNQNVRPVTKPPQKISSTCQLLGAVEERGSSQAVIRLGDGSSIVIEIGDSLANWEMIRLSDDTAFFKQANSYDTLILVPVIEHN